MADYSGEIEDLVKEMFPVGDMTEKDHNKVKDALRSALQDAKSSSDAAPKGYVSPLPEDGIKAKDPNTREIVIGKGPNGEQIQLERHPEQSQKSWDTTKKAVMSGAVSHAKNVEDSGTTDEKARALEEDTKKLTSAPASPPAPLEPLPGEPIDLTNTMAEASSAGVPGTDNAGNVVAASSALGAPPPAAQVGTPSGAGGGSGSMPSGAEGAGGNPNPGVPFQPNIGSGVAAALGDAPLDPNQHPAMAAAAQVLGHPDNQAIAAKHGVQISMPASPGIAPAPKAPDMAALEKDMRDQSAIGTMAVERETQRADAANERAQLAIKSNNDLAAMQADSLRSAQEIAQKHENAYQATMSEYRAVASQGVDPNRFWNSKSTAQKAMAVLAGFCFGFGGKGMEFLNRLDALVSEDMDMQKGDRAAQMEGIRGQAQGFLQARDFAMQKGATAAQAYGIEKAARFEGFKVYLESVAQSNAVDQARITAANGAVALDQHIQQMRQAAHASDVMAWHAREQLKMEKFKIDMTMAEKELKSNGAGSEMKGPMITRMAEIETGMKEIDRMEQEYRAKGTGVLSTFNANTHNPFSDAAEFQQTRKTDAQIIGKKLEGGKLSDKDYTRYLEMMPDASGVGGKQDAKIVKLRQTALDNYTSLYKANQAARVDMSGLPTPDEFAKAHGGGPNGARLTEVK